MAWGLNILPILTTTLKGLPVLLPNRSEKKRFENHTLWFDSR
jgi:hypothetical protein